MKNFVVCAAIAAIALGLVLSNPSNARADQSGDDGFCQGGWIPTFAVTVDIFHGEIYFDPDGGAICHMGDTYVVVPGG